MVSTLFMVTPESRIELSNRYVVHMKLLWYSMSVLLQLKKKITVNPFEGYISCFPPVSQAAPSGALSLVNEGFFTAPYRPSQVFHSTPVLGNLIHSCGFGFIYTPYPCPPVQSFLPNVGFIFRFTYLLTCLSVS